jgi:hypothetical protein
MLALFRRTMPQLSISVALVSVALVGWIALLSYFVIELP